MKNVKAEAEPDKEWVLYDDSYLKHVKGNWKEIVENMSRVNAYPTILLYEKLAAADDYNGDSFKIDEKDLD